MKSVKRKWSWNTYIISFIILQVFTVSELYTQEKETVPGAGEESRPAEQPPEQPVEQPVQPPDQPAQPVEQPVQPPDQPKGPVDKDKALKKNPRKKTFKLNFKDVEITEFLNTMSELIGKNIIVDDRVRGKITITSVKEIPVSNAYEVLKSILELKGFAVIETEALLKIVPVQDAVKKNVEIIIDGKRKQVFAGEEQTITYLLNIEYADANEIANTLRSLKSAKTDVVVYPTLNIIIFSGTSSEIDGLIKIAKALDQKIEEPKEEDGAPRGNIHVVHLENADAEQLAGVLSRIPFSETAKIAPPDPNVPPTVKKSSKASRTTKTQNVAQNQPTTKLSIIANKETNSLIITATPDEYKEIDRLIKALDIVREQVLIEALIVEVSAESGWNLGVDWMMGVEQLDGAIGGSSIMGVPPSFSNEKIAGKDVVLPIKQGFQIGYLSGQEMLGFALLSLSKSDSDFNILSTPQILTIDNHEAELNIGEEIPVASNNRVSDAGTQFYTYEYKTVGIKLKITPHITGKQSQQRITLDLYQEANDVIGTTEGSTIPPRLSKRDISTKVTIEDGKTIVVGGLIKNSKVTQESKVPVLGDIPILGWLFKHMSTQNKKTNLLVFLTPYVVTKAEKADAVTEQRKEEQRRLQNR